VGKFGNKIPLVKDEQFFCTSETLLQRVKGDGWRDFLAQHANGISLKDIADFPLVMPHPDSMLRHAFETCFERMGVTPQVVMEIIDNSVSIEFCKRNYCAGFISKPLLYTHLQNGTIPLYTFPVSDLEGTSTLCLVYSENTIPEYSQDFIHCVKETVAAKNAAIDAYFKDIFTKDYSRAAEH